MMTRTSRDLSRRDLLRWGAASGAALLAGGAASGCGAARAVPPVTSGPVDVSFWTHDGGYIDFFTTAATRASRTTPFTYRLSVTKIGAADLVTKMIAQAVAGRGTPDVAGLEFNAFARVLRGELAEEVLEDLTAAVADVRDDLIAARTAPFTQRGKLYALDSDSPLVVYYYRADRFDALGIPTDIGTWEEFAELGARAHDRHGVSFGAVVVGSELPQVIQSFAMLLEQRGGRLFNADGKLDILTDEAVEVLTFIVRGLRTGFLTTVSDFYGPSMQTALKTGTLLGQFMASWYKEYGLLESVPEQAGNWRIRILPRFRRGGVRTTFAGGTGFAVLRGKANTRSGIDLVKYAYLTPSEQVRRYRELGYLPSRRSVFNDPALLAIEDEFCGGQRLFEIYREIIDEAPPRYRSPDESILDTVLSGYLLKAYKGDLSPREALRRATEDFHGQTRH